MSRRAYNQTLTIIISGETVQWAILYGLLLFKFLSLDKINSQLLFKGEMIAVFQGKHAVDSFKKQTFIKCNLQHQGLSLFLDN